VVWLLAGILVTACKKTPPPPPPPAPSAPAPVAETKPDPWAVPAATAISLSKSASSDEPTGKARIFVSSAGLFEGDPPAKIGSAPSAEGFVAAEKRSQDAENLLVIPIETALHREGARSVELYADASTSFRSVIEAVYTATQSGAEHVELAVTGKDGVRAIPLSMLACTPRLFLAGAIDDKTTKGDPVTVAASTATVLYSDGLRFGSNSAKPCPPDDRTWIGLTIIILKDGIAVKGHGASLGPGCTGAGPGLTIAGRDLHALRACLSKVRDTFTPSPDEPLTISAQHEITTQTLVDVIDAVRVDDSGKRLFGSIRLELLD
jgi:biopolymer transport protein ExbD